MKYSRVFVDTIAYEMAPIVVTSAQLEDRLAPLYQKLHIPHGQLKSLTGIEERRWWAEGYRVTDGAIAAASKAIAESGIHVSDIGAVVYTGVCREDFEPSTACRVAHKLGIGGPVTIHDISNACLGIMSGILDVANRIELGQIKAGLVVSCESARDIVDTTIETMLEEQTMACYARSIATLTGGSGAAAILLTDGSLKLKTDPHQLLGGVSGSAPEHHDICHWGLKSVGHHLYKEVMETDAVAVLRHGVDLALETWDYIVSEYQWMVDQVDKVICHQVGESNQRNVLKAIGIAPESSYSTFRHLGNMGTVSVPITAALAQEDNFLKKGDRVAFLGIGSGLSCMMLSLLW